MFVVPSTLFSASLPDPRFAERTPRLIPLMPMVKVLDHRVLGPIRGRSLTSAIKAPIRPPTSLPRGDQVVSEPSQVRAVAIQTGLLPIGVPADVEGLLKRNFHPNLLRRRASGRPAKGSSTGISLPGLGPVHSFPLRPGRGRSRTTEDEQRAQTRTVKTDPRQPPRVSLRNCLSPATLRPRPRERPPRHRRTHPRHCLRRGTHRRHRQPNAKRRQTRGIGPTDSLVASTHLLRRVPLAVAWRRE